MVRLNRSRSERVRDEAAFSGGSFWKPKSGRNVVRIFMFDHEVGQADFDRGVYVEGEAEIGDTSGEFVVEMPVHFGGGTEAMNCLGSDCPRCSKRRALIAELGSDHERVKEMRATPRFFMNVFPEGDSEMRIWGSPSSAYQQICSVVFDPDYAESVEEDIFGLEGRDFVVEFDRNALPQDMYQLKLRDANKSDSIDADVAEGVQDLFNVEALQPGWSKSKSAKPDKEEEAKAPAKPKAKAKAKAPAKPKSPFVKGARVTVDFDGEDYPGVIDSVKQGVASVTFDDGDEAEIEVGDESMEIEVKETNARAKKGKVKVKEEPEDIREAAQEDPSIMKGRTVTFEDDGESVTGKVVDVEDEALIVAGGEGMEYELAVDGDWEPAE